MSGKQMGRRRFIHARIRGDLKVIPINQVIYFKAEDKYVTVRYVGGTTIIEESLRSLGKDLPGQFIRIHRNALVDKNRIAGMVKSISGSVKAVIDVADEQLAVSRRHAPAVRRALRVNKHRVEVEL